MHSQRPQCSVAVLDGSACRIARTSLFTGRDSFPSVHALRQTGPHGACSFQLQTATRENRNWLRRLLGAWLGQTRLQLGGPARGAAEESALAPAPGGGLAWANTPAARRPSAARKVGWISGDGPCRRCRPDALNVRRATGLGRAADRELAGGRRDAGGYRSSGSPATPAPIRRRLGGWWWMGETSEARSCESVRCMWFYLCSTEISTSASSGLCTHTCTAPHMQPPASIYCCRAHVLKYLSTLPCKRQTPRTTAICTQRLQKHWGYLPNPEAAV